MFGKLEQTEWYKMQKESAEKNNNQIVVLDSSYIIAGKIREVKHDFKEKSISAIRIFPVFFMYTPTVWDKFTKKIPKWFKVCNADFPNGRLPEPGDYWAFMVKEDIKGRSSIHTSALLNYDNETEALDVVDSRFAKPKPNFVLYVSNRGPLTSKVNMYITLDGKQIADQKFYNINKATKHKYYIFPLFIEEGKHTIKIKSASLEFEKKFFFTTLHDVGVIDYFSYPWYNFKKDSVSFSTQKGPMIID